MTDKIILVKYIKYYTPYFIKMPGEDCFVFCGKRKCSECLIIDYCNRSSTKRTPTINKKDMIEHLNTHPEHRI